MYNSEFELINVSLNNLFLDPNNPRFWTEATHRQVPDTKVPEETIQEGALARISEFDVNELVYSILRNRFLPLISGSLPHIVITYYHDRYSSAMGGTGLLPEFGRIMKLVSMMSPRQFLLIPACLLHIAGCDPIIITDGGVNCIEQILNDQQ